MSRLTKAANVRTSAELLLTLALDKDAAVRVRVAANPSTSEAGLVHLSKDRDDSVVQVVAARADLPPLTLWRLAKSKCVHVRLAVADNVSTPKRALVLLVTDEAASVRLAAAARLEPLATYRRHALKAVEAVLGKLRACTLSEAEICELAELLKVCVPRPHVVPRRLRKPLKKR